MARLYNTFEFVGNIHIPKSRDKFYNVNTSDSGWEGHRLNFAVQESKTNSAFLEMYGGFSKSKANKVFSFSKGTENQNGSKLEIPWDDRLQPETVDMVADFKKIVIDFTSDVELKEAIGKLGYEIRSLEYKDELTSEELSKLKSLKQEFSDKAKDRHEFIHEYDAVVFLSNELEKHKDSKFRITGRIEYQEYKGKFVRKFKPEVIEIVSNETPSKLRAVYDVFFTKDALDEKDFKEEKKIYVDGYVIAYDGKAKKDQFFPQQFIINAAKLDMENEMHVKMLEFYKNQFNVKGKGVHHLQWEVSIFRGADQVEFTYNDLTQKQKEAIEFGWNKLEDFAPKGGMLGETTEESRLLKPILVKANDDNDFREGAVESSYTEEDLIYVPAENNKQQDNKDDKTTDLPWEPQTESKPKVELDDLFS
jgi:hypothetical protein